MKKIYITGIAGLLGANLAFLLRDLYVISGVDINSVNIKNVDCDVFDVTDIEILKKTLTERKIDVLIHCVALVNVDDCEKNPETAQKINATLTKDIASVCKELNIKMIYISSDAVFDGEKDGLYTEDDMPEPISVYGKTKLDGEKFVLENNNNLVIRTNMYGFNYCNKSSFGEWLLNSLQNNITLNMVEDIYFSPILVNELAENIHLCIEKDICGLYHICSTGAISKYDFADIFRKVFQIEGVINKVKMKDIAFMAPRTHNMGLSNEKFKALLNVEISTPAEGIEKFKEKYMNEYHAALISGE
jgi:dTDP-4-dehydrorhamnose reductase